MCTGYGPRQSVARPEVVRVGGSGPAMSVGSSADRWITKRTGRPRRLRDMAVRELENISGAPQICSANGCCFGASRVERGIGRMRGRVVHMLECHLFDSLAAWGRDSRSASLALCGQEVSGLLSTENENEVTCKACRARLESNARYTERIEATREFRIKEYELRKAQIKEKRKRTTAINKTRKVPLKIHYGDPRNRSTIVCGMVTGGKGTYDLENVTCKRCRKIAKDIQERNANCRDEWE